MPPEPKKPAPDEGMMPDVPDPKAKEHAEERLNDELSIGDADAAPFAKARRLLSELKQRESKP